MIGREVKKYCCEDISKIENYLDASLDTENIWHCHHRLELCDKKNNKMPNLKKLGLYYNRPAKELIFLSPSNHLLLHGHHSHYTRFPKMHNFNDFLQEKKKIQKKYDFWKTNNPDKQSYYKNKMQQEIQDLLDVYEWNEKRYFKKEREIREFCEIKAKRITYKPFGVE